jgi:hypothetical protein
VGTTVAYECRAPSHRTRDGGRSDKLTVHDGQWAFCPHDARADGHEWIATRGRPLFTLQQAAVTRERDRAKGGVK